MNYQIYKTEHQRVEIAIASTRNSLYPNAIAPSRNKHPDPAQALAILPAEFRAPFPLLDKPDGQVNSTPGSTSRSRSYPHTESLKRDLRSNRAAAREEGG